MRSVYPSVLPVPAGMPSNTRAVSTISLQRRNRSCLAPVSRKPPSEAERAAHALHGVACLLLQIGRVALRVVDENGQRAGLIRRLRVHRGGAARERQRNPAGNQLRRASSSIVSLELFASSDASVQACAPGSICRGRHRGRTRPLVRRRNRRRRDSRPAVSSRSASGAGRPCRHCTGCASMRPLSSCDSISPLMMLSFCRRIWMK